VSRIQRWLSRLSLPLSAKSNAHRGMENIECERYDIAVNVSVPSTIPLERETALINRTAIQPI